MKKLSLFICAIVATWAFIQQTKADAVIDVIETGGNVQATLSGSINLDATQGFVSNSTGYNGFSASVGAIGFTSGNTDYYGLNVLWTPFGPGGFFNWDASSGDAWAMFTGLDFIGVPVGYSSGTDLSASGTMFNQDFATLGFTPGSYVTTFTNGNTSDTVTVNIGQTIPEPASFGLLGLFGLAAGIRRRRSLSRITF